VVDVQSALLSSPPEYHDAVKGRAATGADDSFEDDHVIGRDRPVRRTRPVRTVGFITCFVYHHSDSAFATYCDVLPSVPTPLSY
jgi:hypothetical protein